MANNKFRSKRTRYIDVKHHFIHDAVDAGRVRIMHVKSSFDKTHECSDKYCINKADVWTKERSDVSVKWLNMIIFVWMILGRGKGHFS